MGPVEKVSPKVEKSKKKKKKKKKGTKRQKRQKGDYNRIHFGDSVVTFLPQPPTTLMIASTKKKLRIFELVITLLYLLLS